MLLLGTKEIDLFWGMAKERPGLSPATAQKAVKKKGHSERVALCENRMAL
jgi:hypothetical protein